MWRPLALRSLATLFFFVEDTHKEEALFSKLHDNPSPASRVSRRSQALTFFIQVQGLNIVRLIFIQSSQSIMPACRLASKPVSHTTHATAPVTRIAVAACRRSLTGQQKQHFLCPSALGLGVRPSAAGGRPHGRCLPCLSGMKLVEWACARRQSTTCIMGLRRSQDLTCFIQIQGLNSVRLIFIQSSHAGVQARVQTCVALHTRDRAR
jgi:hypothetical protein